MQHSSTGYAQQGPSAADSDSQRAEKLAQQAMQHYKRADYAEALKLYLEAYQAAPAAGILFNIATIYDKKLGQPDRAMEFYQKVMDAPDSSPETSKKASARLLALRQDAAPPPMGSSSASATAKPAAVPTSAPTPTGPPPADGSGLRTAGLVSAGVGLVGIGLGTYFGLRAISKNNDANNYCVGKVCQDSRGVTLAEQSGTAATVSTISGVVGAAALLGGGLLYYFGVSEPGVPSASRSASVVPWSTGPSSGILITGAF